MKARLVVFPIKGRNWCFSRSADRTPPESKSSIKPQTFKDLWKKFSSDGRSVGQNAEIAIDFAAEKMNRAWYNLEKAPVGTFKNKLHNLGLRLMSRVKPSENFLKSISKEITKVEVPQPSKELEKFLYTLDDKGCVSDAVVSDICKAFDLDKTEVLKYKKSM